MVSAGCLRQAVPGNRRMLRWFRRTERIFETGCLRNGEGLSSPRKACDTDVSTQSRHHRVDAQMCFSRGNRRSQSERRHSDSSVADHPRPLRWERLAAIGQRQRIRVALRRTAAAARFVSKRRGSLRFMSTAFVHCVCLAFCAWHCRERCSSQHDARRRCAAIGARLRRTGFAHRTHGFERTVASTFIFIRWHDDHLSCDSGRSTPPLMCLIGPEAFGITSKAKISLGNHSVAHALGISTTPLM